LRKKEKGRRLGKRDKGKSQLKRVKMKKKRPDSLGRRGS